MIQLTSLFSYHNHFHIGFTLISWYRSSPKNLLPPALMHTLTTSPSPPIPIRFSVLFLVVSSFISIQILAMFNCGKLLNIVAFYLQCNFTSFISRKFQGTYSSKTKSLHICNPA